MNVRRGDRSNGLNLQIGTQDNDNTSNDSDNNVRDRRFDGRRNSKSSRNGKSKIWERMSDIVGDN